MKTNLTEKEVRVLLKCLLYLLLFFIGLFLLLDTSASPLIVMVLIPLGAVAVVKGILHEANKLDV